MSRSSQDTSLPLDGGPAFPAPKSATYKMPDGDHPVVYDMQHGLSLRDYFAAAALQGLCHILHPTTGEEAARRAYNIADAMLKERERPTIQDHATPPAEEPVESRSVQRRVAAQKGLPAPDFSAETKSDGEQKRSSP